MSDWEKCIEEASGDTYYYNRVTGKTSWDPPSADANHANHGDEADNSASVQNTPLQNAKLLLDQKLASIRKAVDSDTEEWSDNSDDERKRMKLEAKKHAVAPTKEVSRWEKFRPKKKPQRKPKPTSRPKFKPPPNLKPKPRGQSACS